MQLFRFLTPRVTKLFSLKQGITLATAVFGALVISMAQVPSAQALSFAPGTEFLPYKNKRACIRNGGNFLLWQGQTFCTRAKQRVRVNSYRTCVKAGGQILESRPRICLWKGRYFAQKKVRPNPKPIVIRNYRDCVNHGGRIKKTNPPRCVILGRTYYKSVRVKPKPPAKPRTNIPRNPFSNQYQNYGDEN